MSATSHDAFPEFPGKVLRIDAPESATASAAPDFTEDLANEITSELAQTSRRKTAAPATIEDVRGPREELAESHPALITSGSVLRERYVIETQLGNGGTSTVFRAIDMRRDASSADGHRVAIKLLRPELRDRPQNIARLQREFRQTQAIAHPNVVRFHDLDCDRASWFIVMELLTGETLGPCLRRASPQGLPEAEAFRIAVAVGEALVHAHALGITHGDIKPDNIYLTTSGDVRLLDFGVAPESMVSAAQGEFPATPVTAAATRVYASPQVLAGHDPEPRDDVFSLSCVIYEMLAGSHPYGRRGADTAQREHVMPAPVAFLDGRRQEVLAAGLDLSRTARPSMEALIGCHAGQVAATSSTRARDGRRTSGRGKAGGDRAARSTKTIAARLAECDRCRFCTRDGHSHRPIQFGTRASGRRARAAAGSRILAGGRVAGTFDFDRRGAASSARDGGIARRRTGSSRPAARARLV